MSLKILILGILSPLDVYNLYKSIEHYKIHKSHVIKFSSA
jgi:hypothetical protein